MDESVVSLTADCKVRGQIATARGSDNNVHVFKGIPFAMPPSGKRRFMPPETFPLWSGIRDAFEYGKNTIKATLLSQYYEHLLNDVD